MGTEQHEPLLPSPKVIVRAGLPTLGQPRPVFCRCQLGSQEGWGLQSSVPPHPRSVEPRPSLVGEASSSLAPASALSPGLSSRVPSPAGPGPVFSSHRGRRWPPAPSFPPWGGRALPLLSSVSSDPAPDGLTGWVVGGVVLGGRGGQIFMWFCVFGSKSFRCPAGSQRSWREM